MGDVVERVTRKNQDLVSQLPLTISAQYGLIDQNMFFDKRVASKDVSGYYLIYNGEFAYNKSTSSDAPWGAIKRLDRYENGVLSTLYIVFKIKNEKVINSDFLVTYYDTCNWHKDIKAVAAEGARNHGLLNIAPADFFKTELMLPQDIEEQKKIGSYFKLIDHLITLHQRKYLQKKKTSLTWEQRKLLSCIQSITDFRGRTPKKLGMDWSESGYLALSALNVKDGYIDFSQDVHYGNQELYDKWMSGKELHRGQVLFTTEAPMGNVAQVPDNKGYILSQRTIAFDVEEKILSENFLATLLRTPNVFNDLIALSSGGTAKGVSQKSLSGLDVVIPKNIDEQNKLADYFINLDNLITLHQRKCDQMKELKKYMLTKMFPQNGAKVPEIRFDGFIDDWEQRKLGDLVGIYDGVHQTPEYQDSGIMFLSVENIATLKSEKYISKEAFERDYKVYPEKGDILMTRIGDVGTTNVVETAKKVAFYVSLALLKPNGINSYFLSNAMKTNAFQKGLRERTLVTAIPQKINKDEIGKIDIFITNNDVEQQKIGAYFSTLDHLITLHQHKCNELREIKKYMLKNMFI